MDASLIEHRWSDRDVACLQAVRPSRLQAEEAVRTLIRWAGDDPERRGCSIPRPGWCAPTRMVCRLR